MEFVLRVKVGKVASFVGKIFVVRPPTTKTTNILPHENYTLYGTFRLLEFALLYRILGDFRGGGYLFVVEQYLVDLIFIVATCTAGKGRQGRFIVGKIESGLESRL